MRRGISISLLLMLSFALAAPVFADGNSSAPVCCRRDGMHHCAGSGSSPQNGATIIANTFAPSAIIVSATPGKCPYCSGRTALRHAQDGGPAKSRVFYACVLNHPAAQAQTEAWYRISFNRSRQKRGPPVA